MNKPTQRTFLKFILVFTLILLTYLFVSTNTTNAEVSISNSVTVTANGGESRASVKTVINGEVIEDWSATSTEPLVYSQTLTSSDNENFVEVTDEEENQSQLKALITQLQTLISLYVSLLNH